MTLPGAPKKPGPYRRAPHNTRLETTDSGGGPGIISKPPYPSRGRELCHHCGKRSKMKIKYRYFDTERVEHGVFTCTKCGKEIDFAVGHPEGAV